MDTTTPLVLYKIPNPQRDVSELYLEYADESPNATDTEKRWIVKEKHGWFDSELKKFQNQAFTLNPDVEFCVDLDQAFRLINKQIQRRANEGFKYLLTLDPYGEPWYKKYEILSDGKRRELPVP
jgi:hypothetical protein